MGSPLNRFNSISRGYDFLTKLVFGRNLYKAQLHFLSEIPSHARILIIGGGTGWILKELISANQTCSVWYVEASIAMIKKAKRKTETLSKAEIIFIHGTEDHLPPGVRFDVVITNCFLDLFDAQTLKNVIAKLRAPLVTNGIWIATDFVNSGQWWHPLLLKGMYLFFSVACDIQAKHLPPWELLLKKGGLKETRSEMFFSDFIKSTVFIKAAAQ